MKNDSDEVVVLQCTTAKFQVIPRVRLADRPYENKIPF